MNHLLYQKAFTAKHAKVAKNNSPNFLRFPRSSVFEAFGLGLIRIIRVDPW